MNLILDMNELIALENDEPQAAHLRELIALNNQKEISLRVSAMSASERQCKGNMLRTFVDFKAWIDRLGLGGCEIVLPLAYLDISFWDYALLGGFCTNVLDVEIHKILFGTTDIEFDHDEHMKQFSDQPPTAQNDEHHRWRNAKCDVLSFWSHVVHGGGVFVTDDRNFHKETKKPDLLLFSGGDILRPSEALHAISAGKVFSPPAFDLRAFIQTQDHEVNRDAVPKEFKHYWKWRNAFLSAQQDKA